MSGERRDALELERLKEEQVERGDQEEKRILHVAMTRAERHLVLSGAVDMEKWPAAKPLGPPVDWVRPALVPGGEARLGASSTFVYDDRVRCEVLRPETVGELLPPEDRAPASSEGGHPEAGERPAPPAYVHLPAPRSLPVARISYSALESYHRCGYRFYLERVAGVRGTDQPPALAAASPARGNGQLVLALDEAEPPPPEPAAAGITALLRGTIVHQLLERYDFTADGVPPPADVEALLRALVEEELKRLQRRIEYGDGSSPHKIAVELQELWEREFAPKMAQMALSLIWEIFLEISLEVEDVRDRSKKGETFQWT